MKKTERTYTAFCSKCGKQTIHLERTFEADETDNFIVRHTFRKWCGRFCTECPEEDSPPADWPM